MTVMCCVGKVHTHVSASKLELASKQPCFVFNSCLSSFILYSFFLFSFFPFSFPFPFQWWNVTRKCILSHPQNCVWWEGFFIATERQFEGLAWMIHAGWSNNGYLYVGQLKLSIASPMGLDTLAIPIWYWRPTRPQRATGHQSTLEGCRLSLLFINKDNNSINRVCVVPAKQWR